MLRKKTPRPVGDTVTYAAVADTDEAVAAAAEDGRLSPSIRREFARGAQFAK